VGAKLILVLISNVIDLTVKLDAKLQSRLEFETIIFKPYLYVQVEEIIYYKYPFIRTILQKDAVTFVAKKIANINSDIRLLEKIYARMEYEHKHKGGK
jgi:Cdc6-like AAA superfamily ATPase